MAVVVVAARIQEQPTERRAVSERIHEVANVIARVTVVRGKTVVGCRPRHGAQCVQRARARRPARARLPHMTGRGRRPGRFRSGPCRRRRRSGCRRQARRSRRRTSLRRVEAAVLDRTPDELERRLRRRELAPRLREPDDREVELAAAGELREVRARRPGRVLTPPPRVDGLPVRLHQAREAP